MKIFFIALSAVVVACSSATEPVGSSNQASTYVCGSGTCGTACNASACSDAAQSCSDTGGDITFDEEQDPSVLSRTGDPGCVCNVTCGPREGAGGCGDGCFWNSDCLNGLSCMNETCWAAQCYDDIGGGDDGSNDPWDDGYEYYVY